MVNDEPQEDGPSYGIGAVARRLGVPAPTLRTWNLRYGIGPSRRSAGGHRRYDAVDLLRLEEMTRLIKVGLPPAEAAHAALSVRATLLEPPPAREQETPATPDTGAGPGATAVPGAWVMPGAAMVPSAAVLTRAAFHLDADAVAEGLEAAIGAHGAAWMWERLALPVFGAIIRRQEATGGGVEIEHLFSERLLSALSRRVGRPPRPGHPRIVLLACAQDEQHSLPVYALAATLTTTLGLETRVLGPRTPYAALADAMRRLGPVAVFVWSQISETGDPAPLAALPVLRPASRTLVGGPGWHAERLPASVTHMSSLHAAVTEVRASLG
ncbi:MerR family transcriptional regulator [Sphaerisporangium sp. NPDC051017]|uniref:MerR family transcriptional regulator n=1 Tax=Sphaerisporangium sp. NPDC051017 TaxID=3154636 RepID=UPI0034457965